MRRLPPSGSTSFASGLNSTGVPAVVVMKSSVATGSPPAAPAVGTDDERDGGCGQERSNLAFPSQKRHCSPFVTVYLRPFPALAADARDRLTLVRCSAPATAKRDGRLPGVDPLVDASVDHRMRVEAVRGEDARRDRRPGPRLADRDERAVTRKVVLAHRQQAVGDVAAAGDVAVGALVLLADVDELRTVVEQRVELVDGDELERLRPAASTWPAMSNTPIAWRPLTAWAPSSSLVAATTTGRSRSIANPAFVENLVPDTGTQTAPGRCPAAKSSTERTSRICMPSGASSRASGKGCAPTNGPGSARRSARRSAAWGR